jgi:hypothetical protein
LEAVLRGKYLPILANIVPCFVNPSSEWVELHPKLDHASLFNLLASYLEEILMGEVTEENPSECQGIAATAS